MENTIRIAASAIVVRDGKILLVRYQTPDGGSLLVGPGGATDHGEDLCQTCVREVREETGLVIQVGNLLFVEDLLTSKYRMFKFWFLAEVVGGQLIETEEARTEGIVQVGWYTKAELEDEIVFPALVKERDWGLLQKEACQTIYAGIKRAMF